MNWKAIGIKLIISLIVVYSIFGIFYHANMMNLFWIGILTPIISYIIGDRFILPRTNNVVATLADFVLSFATLAILSNLFIQIAMPMVIASLFAAFFIALTEPFLHAYIEDREKDEQTDNRPLKDAKLQTEFAEETDDQTLLRKKDPRRDQTE